jgi:hypothetical protein
MSSSTAGYVVTVEIMRADKRTCSYSPERGGSVELISREWAPVDRHPEDSIARALNGRGLYQMGNGTRHENGARITTWKAPDDRSGWDCVRVTVAPAQTDMGTVHGPDAPAREPLTDNLVTAAHAVHSVFGATHGSDDLAAATAAAAHAMDAHAAANPSPAPLVSLSAVRTLAAFDHLHGTLHEVDTRRGRMLRLMPTDDMVEMTGIRYVDVTQDGGVYVTKTDGSDTFTDRETMRRVLSHSLRVAR